MDKWSNDNIAGQLELRAGGDGQHSAPERKAPALFAENAINLLKRLEREILPRLLIVQKTPTKVALEIEKGIDFEAASVSFGALIEHEARREALALLFDLERLGASKSTILIEVIGATARRYGRAWESDDTDFASMTLAVLTMQRVMREFVTTYRTEKVSAPMGRRLLLVSACGDQHTLGISIVSEVFKDAGWEVRSLAGLDAPSVATHLARENFDAVGISATREVDPVELGREIAIYRTSSRNKDLKILLGGRLLEVEPKIIDAVGADLCLGDVRKAPKQVEEILAEGFTAC